MKKILTTLLVLILICTPLMCFTGCQGVSASDDPEIHFVVTGTGEVDKGASFATMTGLTIILDYKIQKWCNDSGKYEYAKKDPTNPHGYSFVPEKGADGKTVYKEVWYLSGTDTASEKAITLSNAIKEGMTQKGFNPQESGTVTLTFGGKSIDVQYNIKTTNGGTGGNTTDGDTGGNTAG